MHQRVTYEWTLRATQTGRGRVGSTLVYIDESEHLTDPIQISIVDQGTASQSGSSNTRSGPPQHQPENVFIRVRASETEVYTNEQLTVEYLLYFREEFQVQNSRMADAWKADGLWREELNVEQRPIPENEVINGIRYNTITLKRSAFFPTRSGPLKINPLRIETEILRPYRRNDPFNFRVPRDERLYAAEIASPPVNVEARPVPGNAPASFNGAVGSFAVSHEIDRTTLEAGEAVTLNVTISGTGNISTVGEPVIDVPASIEVYDPRVETEIDRTNRFLRGEKTLSYTLVPQEAGSFQIPAIEWSYFHPEDERFVTRRTDPIHLTVERPAAPAAAAPGSREGPAGVIASARVETRGPAPLYRQWWPYAGIGGPAVALLLLLGLRRWRDRRRSNYTTPDQQARAAAARNLSRAEDFRRRDQAQAFYESIERAVRGSIGAHLEFPAQGLTTQQLDARLEKADVPGELRLLVRELLNTCEEARFSPAPLNSRTMDVTYNRAANCLARLEGLLTDRMTDQPDTRA